MRTWPWNAIVAEFVGTFLFFFIGIGAGAIGNVIGLEGVALANGLVLAVMVSALVAVSGAHFNPAVTFALWMSSRVDNRRAIAYVIAQLLGAIFAALAISYVFNTPQAAAAATPGLGNGIDVGRGIVIEAILTGILLVAIFGTVVDPRAPQGVAGLVIGLSITADALVGGPLTGAAMNPARWFGPALVAGKFDNAIVWIAGPLLGAAVVATLWRMVFLPQADDQTGEDI